MPLGLFRGACFTMAKFRDTALYEYANRLIALKGQENKIFRLALDNKTIRDLIVFLNTQDQLGQDHVDSKGTELFNSIYNRTVYSANDPKGRAGQRYKLNDTGQFWDSFKAKIGEGFIVIESDPFKGDDNLLEIYGKDVEGLTEENLQVLITEAHEYFIKWYEANLLPK